MSLTVQRAQAQLKGPNLHSQQWTDAKEPKDLGAPGRHQGLGLQTGFHAVNTGCIWHAALILNAPQGTAQGWATHRASLTGNIQWIMYDREDYLIGSQTAWEYGGEERRGEILASELFIIKHILPSCPTHTRVYPEGGYCMCKRDGGSKAFHQRRAALLSHPDDECLKPAWKCSAITAE